MAALTLRLTKGSELTYAELDGNFSSLDAAKLELGQAQASGNANGLLYMNAAKQVVSGSALTFDGTTLNVPNDIQQQNGRYLNGRLAAGTSTRLFGLNGANSLYIGGIDASQSETLFVRGGVTQMTLDASGNLWLGMTPSANAGGRSLNVGNASSGAFAAVSLGGAGSDYGGVGYNVGWTSSSGQYKYLQTDTASWIQFSNDGFRFYYAPSGTAGNAITFARPMTLFASGNLTLGGTNDSARLRVEGTTNLTTGLQLFRSGNACSALWTESSALRFGVDGSTGFTELMALNSTGLGIGTASPGARLHSLATFEPAIFASTGATLYTTYRYSSSNVCGYIGNGDGLVTGGGQGNFGIRSEQDLIFAAGGNADRGRFTSTGLFGVNRTPAVRADINGALGLANPGLVNAATYTVGVDDAALRFTTTACTVTLPAAASFPGRLLWVSTVTAHAVTSASSNVCPLGSDTAGTAILAATAGRFALLQSNGTNWKTLMAN